MKTVVIIAIIIGLLCIVSCRGLESRTTEVIVLHDVTDSLLARPIASEILSLYSLEGASKWDGGYFQLSTLSDVSLSRSKRIVLQPEMSWTSNELERKKQIEKFQKGVKEILDAASKDSIGKKQSSVYLSISRALHTLSTSKSSRKILIVYSDLMENTKELSFYSDEELKVLTANPESVRHKLDQMASLLKLDGIEVHLIYQPMNVEADEHFRIVSTFYQKLLTDRGARVFIEASLQYSMQ